jgi:translation initiation factor IF-1
MDEPEQKLAFGTVIDLAPDLRCRVRLDDGRDISAIVRRKVAREMFRIVPGDRVQVQIRAGRFQMVGFERQA